MTDQHGRKGMNPRMRLRRFLLSFALANLFFNGVEYAVTAQSETRPAVLSAEDMMRILPGNTLLAYDKNGPFWMYFPGPGTVWGQSSSGDVDIGHWWIDGDRYCRSWRVWYGGATQCWKLVTYGDNHIFWMDNSNSVQGESLIQQGNTIGTIRMPQLAAATVASDLDPVTDTATIGPEPRMQAADGSSDRTASHSGSTSGQGGGGDPGGGSSGGGSSGADSSGSGSSAGGSSGDNSSGGGSAGASGSGGGGSSGGGSSAAGGSSSGGNGGGSSSGNSGAGGNAGSSNGGSDQEGSVGGGGDPGKGGGKGHGAGKGQGKGGGNGGQGGNKGGGGDKGGRGGDKGGKGKN